MSEAAIRRATADDREQLCGLIERFYSIDGHEFEPARIDAGLVPLLHDDQHGQVWVATVDDTTVGYVIVTWSWSLESGGRDCILDELYVDRRGNGIGSALLRRALDEAQRAGAAAMFLETAAPNDDARRFYVRHGFAADDSLWMSRPLDSTDTQRGDGGVSRP
ncbi:MAG: GNAT family N-acetyltransferase [Mycobacterium sp.]